MKMHLDMESATQNHRSWDRLMQYDWPHRNELWQLRLPAMAAMLGGTFQFRIGKHDEREEDLFALVLQLWKDHEYLCHK